MRPKERGTDAQDQDRHRGRDRAEQARALGLDIPGRESDEDHSSALGSGRSHGISLISFFTCQVKNWYTLLSRKSQHFCTRIDSSKTAGAQFLRAEWKAVGSGAASRAAGGGGALPQRPSPPTQADSGPPPTCLSACLGQPTPSCYLSGPPDPNSPGRPRGWCTAARHSRSPSSPGERLRGTSTLNSV